MAHTLLGGAILLILATFIGFAFRQGQKVKPSGNNHDSGTQYGAIPGDGSHGLDGHGS
jgi:hypothetical protein